jgi:ATP-dependent protease Clp ATPase subunit
MTDEVRCAWCGKRQSEVKKMIVTSGAGWLKQPPHESSICNECVELCMEVLAIEDADWCDKQIERLRELVNPPDDDSSSN